MEKERESAGWWQKEGRERKKEEEIEDGGRSMGGSEVLPFEFIDITVVKRECVRYKFRIVSTLFGCGK